MKTYFFIFYFLFFYFNANAAVIQGVIKDNETKSAVPFATIYLNKYNSTLSNINGEFIISINNFNSKDTLKISCIGYKSKFIILKTLLIDSINKIYLEPVIYNLSTTEISTISVPAYEILQDAFKNIKSNYETNKNYYKGTYNEQIKEYSLNNWHTRTVNSAIIIEDPGYDKLHNDLFGFLEKIYFVGIRKNTEDSLTKVPAKDGNYLKWALEYNFCRYKNDFFTSPKSYIYQIGSSYYDSILKTKIIEIKITPKNKKEDFGYGEVFISSVDHRIYKIHILYKNEDLPIQVDTKSKDYYKILNTDIVVIYRPNNADKMILSYIKYEFGDGYFLYDNNKPYVVSKKNSEYKTIGEIENGETLIRKLPKMDNNTNIYDQKIMNNKAFWLDYNIVLK